jgi:putative lipase involved disintegration of autophagic bodies
MYPDAKIWLTGHSLGGSLASLVGATFGAPVVAFEAPGEKMAAARLHLPSPVCISFNLLNADSKTSLQPSVLHITNVYHTADPIAMGICNGVTSTCALGGYALESQ